MDLKRKRGALLNRDRDLLRHHGRLVRHVQVVAKDQLQRVLAGRERQRRFRLALAEVDVVGIGGNWLVEGGQIGIPGARGQRAAT